VQRIARPSILLQLDGVAEFDRSAGSTRAFASAFIKKNASDSPIPIRVTTPVSFTGRELS